MIPAQFPQTPVAARGRTLREVIASVSGETDAAQWKPSERHGSLTAFADHEREQRVFGMIDQASANYAAKWGGASS